VPGTIELGDLIRALGHNKATFAAHVAAGASATSIPLADLNLGTANLAGNLVLLDAGALGAGSQPTLATISSNTATTLTVPALPTAPARGATVWIFAVATIQAQVSDNIADWGGQPVAPVDASGAPKVQFATSLANFVAQGAAVAATTPLLATYGNTKAHFTPAGTGRMRVDVALSAAALVSVSRNAGAGTPIYNALNGGNSLAANAEFAFDVPVDSNDTIDFQVSAAVTLNVFKVYFTYGA
jgi:hypothetical protein